MEPVRPIPEDYTKNDLAWTISDYFREVHGLEVEVGPVRERNGFYYFPVSDTNSDSEWLLSVESVGKYPEDYHEWVEKAVDTAVRDD